MQNDRHAPSHRPIRRLLFACAVTVAAFGAGTSVADASASLRTTPPDTTPVTTPDTVPDTVPNGGGDDSDVPWGWIIAITAVAIAVIALVATSTGRRRTTAAPAAAPIPRASTAEQDRGYALGSAQWVHDHLAPELLVARPDLAAQRWNAERGRLDDAVIRSQQYMGEPSTGVAWQRLSQSLSLLATSLESYVQLRNQQPPDQQQINDAYAVANQHLGELGVALSQLWPTIQR